jgi:hypothetical protein
LIIYGFTSRSRIFHIFGDVTIADEGLQQFRPMLGAQGLLAGRDLYRATRDLGFSGLIRRTAPFSRLLRHAWGCGGPILTRILTGRYQKKGLIMHLYLWYQNRNICGSLDIVQVKLFKTRSKFMIKVTR